jgi:uncharacterized protein (TIGR03067 family)
MSPSRSPVPAAIVTALIHVAVWGAFAGWLHWAVQFRQAFEQMQMRLPWVTELTLNWSLWLTDLLPLTLAAGAALLVADVYLLIRLGRPEQHALRELWSGMMIVPPVLMIVVASAATVLPFMKLTTALTNGMAQRDVAIAKETNLLQGTWRVVRMERDGKDVPAADRDHTQLTLRTNLFRWEGPDGEAGSFYPIPHRRPMMLDLVHTSGLRQGQLQQAIYKLEGDRLTLCVAPVGATGDELPADFATAGTKLVLYVLEKVKEE